MRIDITNEKVLKDEKPLEAVIWVDSDNNEACIFCHDHEGRKLISDRDPTGYETLLVKGTFTISKPTPAAKPQPNYEYENEYYGSPGYPPYPGCLQGDTQPR